jgi:hypothetical protein
MERSHEKSVPQAGSRHHHTTQFVSKLPIDVANVISFMVAAAWANGLKFVCGSGLRGDQETPDLNRDSDHSRP